MDQMITIRLEGFRKIKNGLEELIKGWELIGFDKQSPLEYQQMQKQLDAINKELVKWQ